MTRIILKQYFKKVLFTLWRKNVIINVISKFVFGYFRNDRLLFFNYFIQIWYAKKIGFMELHPWKSLFRVFWNSRSRSINGLWQILYCWSNIADKKCLGIFGSINCFPKIWNVGLIESSYLEDFRSIFYKSLICFPILVWTQTFYWSLGETKNCKFAIFLFIITVPVLYSLVFLNVTWRFQ